MKKIKYKICNRFNRGTEESPVWVEHLLDKRLPYYEANMEIAQKESYNGEEPEIFDDGKPEPPETPSQLDAIEAQVTYTAMMTDTLLEV